MIDGVVWGNGVVDGMRGGGKWVVMLKKEEYMVECRDTIMVGRGRSAFYNGRRV
jgi:hypothetical protein